LEEAEVPKDCTTRRRRRRLKSDDLKCEFISSLVIVLLRCCTLTKDNATGLEEEY